MDYPKNKAIRAYTVSLPRYTYTVAMLTRDRLIDDFAHRFEPAISHYPSCHMLHFNVSLAIDNFTFIATNMFIVQGLQYLHVIFNFDFP